MRNLNKVLFPLTGLAVALAAGACSSTPEAGTTDSTGLPGFSNGNGNTNGTGVDGSGNNTGDGVDGSGNNTGDRGDGSGNNTGDGVDGSGINEGNGDTNLQQTGDDTTANNGDGTGDDVIEDTAPQATPLGYFESGAWHGFGWTGDDELGIGTTRSVDDFSGLAAGEPFCLTGAVGGEAETSPGVGGYGGVALLGFNINQDAFGATEGIEATVNSIAPTSGGVAVNYTKTSGITLRIQLQGPNGDTLSSERWCAELTEVQGPGFIPYEDFRTECWIPALTETGAPNPAAGAVYNREPLAAVVMLVPGGNNPAAPTPYDICVSGFADGESVADAPTSINLSAGLLTGIVSLAAGKQKVLGSDGQSYVINNNAWGDNSSDRTQSLRYTGNGFEILAQSAGEGANSSPASFPSIYIGANGAQSGVNGATTTGDNPLPIQVSAINSIPTRFAHSGPLGDNNATYDVWFAPGEPSGEYDTALAAFLMVWTHQPNGRVAIGGSRGPFRIQGQDFELFVGPRGGDGADRDLPVISYVATNTVRDYSFDLDVFIEHAIAQNTGLTNGMFLTDVFAGFEIWSGGTGLRIDEFSAVINP